MKKNGRSARAVGLLLTALIAVLSVINAPLLLNPAKALLRGRIGFAQFAQEVREAYLSESFFARNAFISLNGLYARITGQRLCNGVLRLSNGHLVTDLTQEEALDMREGAQRIAQFAREVQAGGAEFLYIQAPTKADAQGELLPAGIENNLVRNAQALMGHLNEYGVDTLDLSPYLTATPEMIDAYFYRTDHHWNYDGAFEAFGIIAGQLQAMFPQQMTDLTYTDKTLWEAHTLRNWFLGSWGRRAGPLYAGIDDLTYYTPRFDTRMTCSVGYLEKIYAGSFEEAIIRSEMYIDGGPDYFDSSAYCLSVGADYDLVNHRNAGAPNDLHVLLIKDSFALPLQGYLSALVDRLDVVDPRYFSRCSMAQYVADEKPDVVLMLYNPAALNADEFFAFGSAQESGGGAVVCGPEDVSVQAGEEAYCYETLDFPLEYGARYRLTFDGIDTEPDVPAAAARLYNETQQGALDYGMFDLEWCRENGFSWTFATPGQGTDKLVLQLSAGIPGKTQGVSARYRHVVLQRLL